MSEIEIKKNQELADLLFSDLKKDRKYFEDKRLELISSRDLKVDAEVTRVGPSPTGPMHIGTLYMALVSKKIAKQSGGLFYLRIEDTDKVREVEGAREFIKSTLNDYGLSFDEIYTQSERSDIYKAFAKDLVLKGLAYPCFMTSDELSVMREEQTAMKVRPGVYGKHASSRDLSFEEIKNKLEKNKNVYVLRLKAFGDVNKKEKFVDQFLGEHNIPENDEDFVLLKSDGVPTYHLAHVVDDYVLGTTFVTRAEEWLSSMGKHLALWKAIDVDVPKYGHIMPINKKEGGSVRKLSKRKDPEAGMSYWKDTGYTTDSIISYLLRLANPDLDIWWDEKVKNNIKINISQYELDLKQMKRGSRGPLLDFDKLNNMSADIVAGMSAKEVSENILAWCKNYNTELFKIVNSHENKSNENNKNYLERILNIEREGENKRKDIAKWSDAEDQIFYFYDELFEERKIEIKTLLIPLLEREGEDQKNNLEDKEKNKNILKDLFEILSKEENKNLFDLSISLEEWIASFKNIFENNFKEKYNIKFGELMMMLRCEVTTKDKTPNLYYVFEVLGRARVIKRLK